MQIFLVLNGQSAGPFDEAQVRAMLAAGQATPETQCCPVGEHAWRSLGSVLDGGGGAFVAPGNGMPPFQGGMPYAAAPPPPNGLAITSLVLGCASVLLCCFTSIPAIITGHIARGQINRSGGAQGGAGMATAGLVLGYLATLSSVLLIVLALPAMQNAQNSAREMRCLSDARQIGNACRMYASDNDGVFPPRLEDLFPTYLTDKEVLLCPLKAKGEGNGYEYFGGKEDDPADKVLLRSRDLSPTGRRIVVHVDTTTEKVREGAAGSR